MSDKLNILKEITEAKNKGVPLVSITSQDQIATLDKIKTHLTAEKMSDGSTMFRPQFVEWDYVNGLRAKTLLGKFALLYMHWYLEGSDVKLKELRELYNDCIQREDFALFLAEFSKYEKPIAKNTKEPVAVLQAIQFLPEDTIVFMLNFQRFLTGPPAKEIAQIVQSLINIRNPFKSGIEWLSDVNIGIESTGTRMLVLFSPDDLPIPLELSQDFLLLDEELPDEEKRKEIILSCFGESNIAAPDEETLIQAMDLTRGMIDFSIEQEVSLSIGRLGIDTQRLKHRAIKVINSKPGLKVLNAPDTLDQIGGSENAISYLTTLVSNNKPGSLFFIDEIEKDTSGSSGGTEDTSGVSQGIHGELLKWIVNKGVFCILFFGIGGTGKTSIAKALANYVGVTAIEGEIQAMKSKFVGESSSNIRNALKTVDAFSPRYTLLLATTNDPTKISPELLSRFAIKFYFPMPGSDSLKKIWDIHTNLRGLPDQEIPNSTGWVGRDVFNCCWNASFSRIPLVKAAQYVSYAGKTAAEEIAKRDEFAEKNGYISADYEGMFKREVEIKKALQIADGPRKIRAK